MINFKGLLVNDDVRSKRMNINILLMLAFKGLSIITSLLFVPLYLKSIDRNDYGVLITLTSMISWIAMLDIGFGNGLRNKLTLSISNKDFIHAKKYVSSAYAGIAIYITVISISFISISHLVSWSDVLNVNSSREQEMYILVNTVFILFGLNFILGIINTIIFASQQPALQSIIVFATQIFSFIAVLTAIKVFSITSILTIGIINSIISPIVLLFVSIILFKRKFREFAPNPKLIDISTIKEIFTLGIKFFILQIITLILFSVNNVLILHLVNANAVVEYNIAYRYIDVLAIIFTIFITPVWSASTEAFARNDVKWIRKTVQKMIFISFIIIIGGLFMIILSKPIFNLWLGKDVIDVSVSTLILTLLFVAFRMFYQTYGYVINGSGKLKAQIALTSILAILYIPLSIMFGKYWGLHGIILISAMTQFCNFLWSQRQYKFIINNTGKQFWHD